MGNFFFLLLLDWLPASETVSSNEKLRMGTEGASIKHLGRPGTAQARGGKQFETVNKFHTFSVVAA